MRFFEFKANMKAALSAATVLLLGVGVATAQQQINLTAAASTAPLPDGSAVPMWGYSCMSVTGTAPASGSQTCKALNLSAAGTWSPIVITVPSGQNLTINLTNNLPATVPTSIMIVGQLGGGLGTPGSTTLSPDHSNAQSNVTWPIVPDPASPGTPPTQGSRVQSFGTEVGHGATTLLTWTAPRAGTYLIESGTHPSIQGPMGLYGILVVTTPPSATAGTAYPAVGTTPAVTYNADVPLILSEIDPVQNNAVSKAVGLPGFNETTVWSGLPGGCGNPATANSGNCYPPAVNYTPLYYLINGVAFNKTSANGSLFPVVPGAGVTGTVLVRIVNAGLRMHVPSIVGSQTGIASPAASGFSLIAEDGNRLPGTPRVQSEVFMAAGKTYDIQINVPTTVGTALPIYDRELSLSGNAIARDSGMLAYIGINGAGVPVSPAIQAAAANPDTYNSLVAGQTLTVSDPSKGVIANDVNVFGVHVVGTVSGLTLNTDGTFTYTGTPTTFTYCGNGATTGPACAVVTLGAAPMEASSGITCNVPNPTYGSNVATTLSIKPPGILAFCKDAAGYPLSVSGATATAPLTGTWSGGGFSIDVNGGFTATTTTPGSKTFSFTAQNSQGTQSSTSATVTVVFPAASNLAVTVLDGSDKKTAINDYRWIIEEDRTFFVDPNCTTNPPPAGCPLVSIPGLDASGNPTVNGIVPTFGTNFHTSYMPVVAQGCVGTLACESGQKVQGQDAVCDIGNGICRTLTGAQQTPLDPKQVYLDPAKRYYLTIFPGDAANSFENAATCTANCGHGMGGAPIAKAQTAVTVYTQPNPFPTAKLAVFVFEDDFPLNGEQDAGGGIDVLASNEPGLGGFNVALFDDAGGTGDATGQMTYDMFNQPLTNSLAGTIDPATQKDACPISAVSRTVQNADGSTGTSPTGIAGTIVTCPRFESDGKTLSPLAGQVVVANLMPGRYGVVATPAADRIGRGEEWLQTNTLDGQKAHDSFLKVGEAGYFQEYGPAGYHVSIGFANPTVINARLKGVCNGTDPNVTGTNCKNTVQGLITTERMSRTPDERLYSSGSNDSFAFTQCYVSIGDTDGEDFAFTKCGSDGSFSIGGLPDGNWRVTVFDQWNDMLVDGLSTPVVLGGGSTTNMGQIAMNQWQANIYTSTFFDKNGNGLRDSDEAGLSLVATNIRFRDGSYSNFNNTDLQGNAGFNEVFPLFSWYTVETDSTRYKNTGVHVVYDAGGPADTAGDYKFMANTAEAVPLPTNLRVPGAVYCATANCAGASIATGPLAGGLSGSTGSTGRIDPPWVTAEGWQGFSGQNSFLDFGKTPFVPGETGGIHGEVIYASTRPFDDPALLIHTSWTPDVPGVVVNLYQETTAPDGSTGLHLIDTTKTSSWDDWAQGFRSDGRPNMNCPGQTTTDQFYFTLYNQPEYLDLYTNVQHGTATSTTAMPVNAQFKCYDGMHNWNQLQPAPYDGAYQFPSVTGINPATGKSAGSNCHMSISGEPWGCIPNPDSTDPYRAGSAMLPPNQKYVVEMVVPPGYELVKEEDKNILIGDNYIAPVTQEFGGLGAIYILPDQAEVSSAFNPNNLQNPTNFLGRNNQGGLPQGEGDTGSVEQFWPCVGAARTVPDYISLFPQSAEVAPFAGATRNLCDRKEVTLTDQTAALAKFWVFTSTHVAAHFTGVITDDFTSEFDPFSPQFGEKFAPPNLPISIKDWTGTETQRVYTDQWGAYDGLTYSTWEVNPPNPTGYAPTMMVTCMNDPGTGTTPDALFNPGYSQFCYEIPFMPGQTQYMDTPVTPTTAYSEGYNHPDCSYPDTTPAVSEVDGDGIGPWSAGAGGLVVTLTTGGSGYSSSPAVTITGGGGSGASATTLINGSVTSLQLTSAGSGYTSLPVADLVGGGGRGATATAIGTGVVASIKLASGGAGYSSVPTVGFSGGGGTGAAATAQVTGSITGVTITNGGSGYLALLPPLVTFAGGGGSGAAGTAILSSTGSVGAVVVTNLLSLNPNAYSTNATITVAFSAPPPGGTLATGTVTTINVLGRKRVTGVTFTNHGSGYTSAPTVMFTATSGTTFTAATANSTLAYSVASVTMTSGGSNYTSIPTVSFLALAGSGAAGKAVETGSVTKITLTSGGSGYTSAPTVNIIGGGGSGAAASDSIAVHLTGLTLTAAGSGYTIAPQIQFIPPDGNGSGAAATDTIAGPVASIVVNNPGAGYASNPTVTIDNPPAGGTLATASASVSSGKLTITALADQQVLNNGYSGPSATSLPFNAKTVTRKYGFGATAGTVALVGADGVARPLTGVSWGAGTITGFVPANLPACLLQQQPQYGGPPTTSPAKCGQLVITTAQGKTSIDTVTVTIGGKSPTVLAKGQTIQSAIDAAAPGDLVIVPAGTYTEMLLMWKPVRLQGVGAPSAIINANSQPEGRLDPWRRSVSCLFGLAMNGQPLSTPGNLVPAPGAGDPASGVPAGTKEPLNQYDSTGQYSCPGTGWNYFYGGPNNPQVDRVPLEGILGWDTTLNGNLAELLQEPSLMGAYEGAGITVLAKGVRYPAGLEVFGAGQDLDSNATVAHEGQMPAKVNADGSLFGTVLLTNSSNDCATSTGYSSNFQCNPSRIDGLSVTNSSQGGGGIFVHGWAHNLEIANNRVMNNSGTLTGGITVGQGESPDALLSGNDGNPVGFDQQPWTCVPGAYDPNAKTTANQVPNPPGFPTNAQLPYCYNTKVNVHNNSVSLNSSIGDELFSSTPAGAGGITMAVGSDNYNVSNNWVCGNLSTGDGGGIAHLGASFNGAIQHNSILFNQSTNPTVPTNGGGIIVMAAAPDGTLPGAAPGTECGSVTDVDCAPGLPDGTGPGMVIDSNLIMGNSAESGSGGGIRFQSVNGTDVGFFPLQPAQWNSVNVTNNIIANNEAGWDGAGISLQDSLAVNIINNTIISNDTTASAGVLFNTLGAPIASAPGDTNQTTSTTSSAPQAAGVVTMRNTSLLTQSLPLVICPAGHGSTLLQTCKNFSVPRLDNDVIWQNRSFYIGVLLPAADQTNQQNQVALFNSFTGTPGTRAVTQPTAPAATANGGGTIITGGTGACVAASYWEIGVRGDKGPAASQVGAGNPRLSPAFSVITDVADYPGLNNTAGNPTVLSQYCNGSRTPPEFKSLGYQVPPGIADATVPNPIFSLTPAATVDEGNNWINMSWGPLALTNPSTNTVLGNYAPASTSSVINLVPSTASTYAEAPPLDLFGTSRKTNGAVDAGAVEFVAAANTPLASVTGGPLAFGNVPINTTSAAQTLTMHNTGTANVTGISVAVTTGTGFAAGGTCGTTVTTLAPAATCTITVTFHPTATGAATGQVTITSTNVGVTGSPVLLSGTGVPVVNAATLTPTSHAYPAQSRSAISCGTADLGCLAAPLQVFTLTNTGNVPLSGITQGTLGGTNPVEFNVDRLVSTCGPAGGGQVVANTTLAPGATCVVTVAFHPLSTGGQTTGAKSATISVTDGAGTQSSTLTGTAN